MKKKYHFLLCLLIVLYSCNSVINEAQNWIEKTNQNTSVKLQGNHFLIDNGPIKVFLPEGFEEYAIERYKTILDSSLSKEQAKNEIRRLEVMRGLKGSFSIFYDHLTTSTFTINTLPYMNFNKRDAKMLLSIIKQKNDQVSLATDLNFKKLTAAYAKNKNFTMFRSIFEIDNFKTDLKVFSTFYFISASKQTFMINLTTPFEVNFDGYIEKMKF